MNKGGQHGSTLYGIVFREVHSLATKNNFKMMQVLCRQCLGTGKTICSNTHYSSSSSPITSLTPTILPLTHTGLFSSICFPTYLPSTFLLLLPFFPCRLTQLLELSSASFIPLIILPIYHSPYPEFPSPKKQSGIKRTLSARGKLRGGREFCEHLPVNNFHSENYIYIYWEHSLNFRSIMHPVYLTCGCMLSHSVVSSSLRPHRQAGSWVQARTLEWFAFSFSREFSWLRDPNCICHISCTAGGLFTRELPEKPVYLIDTTKSTCPQTVLLCKVYEFICLMFLFHERLSNYLLNVWIDV